MDLISREWLKTAIHNLFYELPRMPDEEDIQAYIDAAPPVKPQEPCENWCDVPSNEMDLEQARQTVRVLRNKLVEYLERKEIGHNGCDDCKYGTFPDYYPCCECKNNYVDKWQMKEGDDNV